MSNVAQIRPAVDTEWLSPEQVCEHIPGMTLDRLEGLRKTRTGPRFFKPTLRTVVYSRAEVDAWVRSTAVQTRAVSR